MKSFAKKMVCALFALCLTAGMLPASALAATEWSVGKAEPVAVPDGEQGSASTDVFIDVLSTFRLIDITPDFVADSVQDALARTDGRLFATLDGGSGVASATWTVKDATGAVLATFDAQQAEGGKWVLPLSADGSAGTLKLESPGEYTCAFSATDRSGTTVAGSVSFQVLADGEISDHGPKTVYKDHEQTTDGVATYAEPSATGLIHKLVQHLAAVEAVHGSATRAELERIAAAYAATNGQSGVYDICAAWSLGMQFSIPPSGDADPYKGDLSVVIPLSADAPAAGSAVIVFGYNAKGEIEPFTCTVMSRGEGADAQRYVSFTASELGAYAVGVYRAGSGSSIVVTSKAEGAGFINYEGAFTWPSDVVKRYIFTPVDGNRLAELRVSADGVSAQVPNTVALLGYYDLDLAALPKGTTHVSLVAIFKPIGSPDDPGAPDATLRHTLTTRVSAGSGAVMVNGVASEGRTFEFTAADMIELEFIPESPSQSIEGASISIDGSAPLPIAVYGGRAVVRSLSGNAVVDVRFSSEPPAVVAFHSVTLNVTGGMAGHGSIDTPYSGGATVSAVRSVADGDAATFALFPEEGYGIYTVMDGAVEIGAYLSRSASGLALTLPDVHRDHEIWVEFRKVEDKPPLIPEDRYVTIQTESVVDEGSAVARPATITPPSAVIPRGSSYSFAVIPANAQSVLSSVWMKGEGDLPWIDITDQVYAAWTEWPQTPAGVTSTGYYDLTLTGVAQDTFVRVSFRDAREGDPLRPPTPTRNVRINVAGEGGTVSPNTMGTAPLKVPVGKSVQVTIIRADGAYVSSVVTAGKNANRAGSDTTGVSNVKDKDVLDGSDTFEIPDSTEDEDYTFEFTFGDGTEDPDDPNEPVDPSDPDDPNKPTDPDDPKDPSVPNDPAVPSDPDTVFTITPIVEIGSDGKTHGSIFPAQTVSVRKGDSCRFSFIGDDGYQVGSITANGRVLTRAAVSSWLLGDVQEDIELRVTFVPSSELNGIAPIKRPIHRLQSLAQTGDLMAPAIVALLALSCGAAGFAFLAAARRRRQEDDRQ